MKIYLKQNVYEAALDRIRYLFDEFSNIIVNISGGKDSTVIFHLALQVAKEKNRLPLKVFFIDQEAEWQCVIDYMKTIMYREDVEPLWLQAPLKLFNATSHVEHWLHCWDEKEKDNWIHPKDPISIKENKYGTDRFAEMFTKFIGVEFKDQKACYIAGVRTEESPARFNGLTNYATYKYITWGKKNDIKNQHYTFYPIYDWSYTDVWKFIHDNKIEYCKLYDYMYQSGYHVRNMRVSNVHHETAVIQLFNLQEIEINVYNKLIKRIGGINSASQMQKEFTTIKELPAMFKSWVEYRNYLLENLITDVNIRNIFKKQFDSHDDKYIEPIQSNLIKMQISSLLVNDYHGTKLSTFHAANGFYTRKKLNNVKTSNIKRSLDSNR